MNCVALSRRLLPRYVHPYWEHVSAKCAAVLRAAGFYITRAEKAFPQMRFTDVAALVCFAFAIPWAFPDFPVDRFLPELLRCQAEMEMKGSIYAREHRFPLTTRKPPVCDTMAS